MKAVAYIALALSLVALALGIYAFTGGFGSAGTFTRTPLRVDSNPGSTATTGTPTTTTVAGTVSPVAADPLGQVEVTLKLKDGSSFANLTLQPLVYTADGKAYFMSWQASSIAVVAPASVIASVITPSDSAALQKALTSNAYTSADAALLATAALKLDLAQWYQTLLAAADKYSADSGSLVLSMRIKSNFGKIFASVAIVTGATMDSAAKAALVAIVHDDSDPCKGDPKCDPNKQGN